MNKIFNFISENTPEIVLIIGLFFIISAAFLINFILGVFILGIVLVVLGVFLAREPKK